MFTKIIHRKEHTIMFDQLKHHYSHAISSFNLPVERQFIVSFPEKENGQLILDKSLLSDQEISLLRALFQVIEGHIPLHNSQDQKFYELLIEKKEMNTEGYLYFPIRCIHFSVLGDVGDRSDFSEAMKGLFPASLSLVWKTATDGFLLQQVDSEMDESIALESIVDTIASDFYVKVSLYVGSSVPDTSSLIQQYDWENKAYSLVKRTHPSRSYFIEQDVTTYLLLDDASPDTIQFILSMLDPVRDDRSLLQSVKTYLECNMNTSLAAKKMFMHRNTLQYRVDKFIEKTSIDIKQFPNAVAVYFMLLSFNSLKNE
ncbi:hypothetical protein CR203_00200 [Salipaludibacillus neizhouensis]|uniref:PucR C-terminal helix-turn-helix domain-containing protein n=2 Tax=Salipaludibacillus neizhouensis TaxID=885475 RepID=A0A3A9KV73_9BACI|nr:hypothetical protein CR203_00200 [Salipaludibacillus neizhouensis]